MIVGTGLVNGLSAENVSLAIVYASGAVNNWPYVPDHLRVRIRARERGEGRPIESKGDSEGGLELEVNPLWCGEREAGVNKPFPSRLLMAIQEGYVMMLLALHPPLT
jgi:hypothetical protein